MNEAMPYRRIYFQPIIEIADGATPETVNIARLRVDSRKFSLARLSASVCIRRRSR